MKTEEQLQQEEQTHQMALQMIIDRKNGKDPMPITNHKNEAKESVISDNDVKEFINQKIKNKH